MRFHAEPAREKANESIKNEKCTKFRMDTSKIPFWSQPGHELLALVKKKGREAGDISTGGRVQPEPDEVRIKLWIISS